MKNPLTPLMPDQFCNIPRELQGSEGIPIAMLNTVLEEFRLHKQLLTIAISANLAVLVLIAIYLL
jgi:hypothetical protein